MNLKLVLVGPHLVKDGGGGTSYINVLNNLAKNFTLEWIDPISDPFQLRNEIAKSDIFCYPSIAEKGETFGVAPLEAMATGRATIVSELRCFQDFVKNDINGLVFNHRAANSVELLKQKLEILIDNIELREALSKEGAKTALEFSNEKIAEQYLNDFETLLNKKY